MASCAPCPRDRAEAARSIDPFAVGIEADLAHEKGKLNVHVVLGLDLDVAAIALDRDFSCRFRQFEGVRTLTQVPRDLLIGVVRSETHFLPNGVLILIEAKIMLAD